MVISTEISFVLGYIEPTGGGYCVPVKSTKCANSQCPKAAHCKCSNVDSTAKCQELCQNDDRCKGFSLLEEYENCYIYTSSNCDSTKNCLKKNQDYCGEIKPGFECKNSRESGCYIKKTGKL